jgi:hypothetical protein
MFNGVGIPTPRGTGTSGYVQKSLAFIKSKPKNNSYKDVLNKFKENPTPVRKTINEDILKHEILYKIESELLKLKRLNKDKFSSEKDLNDYLSNERKRLEKENLIRNIVDEDNKPKHLDTHQYNLMQEEKNQKLKQAFGIGDGHVFGEAFDIELQEEKIKKLKEEKKYEIKEREKAKTKEIHRNEKLKLKKEMKEKELKLLQELEKKELEMEKEANKIEKMEVEKESEVVVKKDLDDKNQSLKNVLNDESKSNRNYDKKDYKVYEDSKYKSSNYRRDKFDKYNKRSPDTERYKNRTRDYSRRNRSPSSSSSRNKRDEKYKSYKNSKRSRYSRSPSHSKHRRYRRKSISKSPTNNDEYKSNKYTEEIKKPQSNNSPTQLKNFGISNNEDKKSKRSDRSSSSSSFTSKSSYSSK